MVSTIFSYGEDALDNEAVVRIQFPSFMILDDLDDMLTFRAVKFSAPSYKLKTFTQSFRGYQIERWKPGRDSEEVTVTFRLDKYWRVYDALYDWISQLVNLEHGTAFIDTGYTGMQTSESHKENIRSIIIAAAGLSVTDSLRGTMTISQENISGDTLGKGWTYYGVFPKELPSISYDLSGNGSAIDIDVSFGYQFAKRES